MHRFKYLQYSLATILVLAGGIGWSLWKTRNDMPEPAPHAKPVE